MTSGIRGLAGAGLLAITPAVTIPLGRLGPPMTLVIVLPALAIALESFGWRDRLAGALLRLDAGTTRALAAYAVWLGTSALLSLDVAAVLATSVGLAASRSSLERRWHLGSAILGSNLGSLLLPYSNLTNLVVASAAGIAFGVYVGLALVPQLVAALVGGLVLAGRIRSQRSQAEIARNDVPTDPDPPTDVGPRTIPSGPASRAGASGAEVGALVVAVAASALAVVTGLLGGDLAVPFAVAAAILAGAAIRGGRLHAEHIARAVPLGAIAVILAAAAFLGQVGAAGSALPVPAPDAFGLLAACFVGGGLSMAVNNLPAAAFGAVWLAGASPVIVMAYLIGTNFACLATPYGSVATVLARSVAGRAGHDSSVRTYLATAWRFAAPTTIAALGTLILVR